MAAAGKLRPPLRGARHATLIGLLAVTGMRPGEAVGARPPRRRSEHRRSARPRRQAEKAARGPLHTSTISALRDYARLRDARFPGALNAGVLHLRQRTTHGHARSSTSTFTNLIREVGLDGRGARARPRPHDLRHAFAVHTLLDWYRAGEDIDRRMPLLSTWLGHVDPASTYWYLEAVPELLELISRRLEQLAEVLS